MSIDPGAFVDPDEEFARQYDPDRFPGSAPKVASDEVHHELRNALIAGFITAVVAARALDWKSEAKKWQDDGWDGPSFRKNISGPFGKMVAANMVTQLLAGTVEGRRRAQIHLRRPVTQSEWMKIVRPWADAYASTIGTDIASTSEKAVQESLLEFINKKTSPTAAMPRLRDIFGLDARSAKAYLGLSDKPGKGMDMKEISHQYLRHRAEMNADVNLMTAFNFGRQLLFMQSLPDTERKVWVTAIDERTCETCAPMDGVAVPMKSAFDVLMPIPKTFKGKGRPTQSLLVPPVHPNCRCTIVPESTFREGMITRTARFDDDGSDFHLARLTGDIGDLDIQKNINPHFERFVEAEHPRGHGGKFADKNEANLTPEQQKKKEFERRAAKWGAGIVVTYVGLEGLAYSAYAFRRGLSVRIMGSEGIQTFGDLHKFFDNPAVSTGTHGAFGPVLASLKDTRNQGKAYQYIRPDAYKHLERDTHDKTIGALIGATKNSPIEHSFLVDEKGKILAGFRGKEGETPCIVPAGLTKEDRGKISFFHNHPQRGFDTDPLSGADIDVFSLFNFKNMFAADANGSLYTLTNNGGNKFTAEWGSFQSLKRGTQRDSSHSRVIRAQGIDNNQDFLRLLEKRTDKSFRNVIGVDYKRKVYKKYDPKQPRDEHGRFTRFGQQEMLKLKSGTYKIPRSYLDSQRTMWGFRIGQDDHVNRLAHKIKAEGFEFAGTPITIDLYPKYGAVRIRDGQHRLEAARRLKMSAVPVRIRRRKGAPPPAPTGAIKHWENVQLHLARRKLQKAPPAIKPLKDPNPVVERLNQLFVARGEEATRQKLAQKRGWDYVRIS